MANATLLTGRSCRGYLYTLAGLFFAVLLVIEVCKWEVHVGSEGIELIRKSSPRAPNFAGLNSAAAKSTAASRPGQKLTPKKTPRARRKYSLPWGRAPDLPTRTASFHNGVRSSRVIEGELGLGFRPKLELEAGTLTWSAEAEDFLLGEIVKRQFPKDCGAEKWLVIEPHRHGKPVTIWTSDPCELKVVQRSSSARITLTLLLLGCKEKTYKLCVLHLLSGRLYLLLFFWVSCFQSSEQPIFRTFMRASKHGLSDWETRRTSPSQTA